MLRILYLFFEILLGSEQLHIIIFYCSLYGTY